MENLETTDANQLTLFDLPTVEQLTELNRRLESINQDELKREERYKKEKQVLLDKGFVEGIDFVDDSQYVEHQQDITVFYGRDNQRVFNQTVKSFSNRTYLIFDEFDKYKNQINKRRATFNINRDNKIECYALTNQYRYIKSETILNKIKAQEDIAQNQSESFNNRLSVVEYTINKYKKLYPEAEVTSGRGYNNNRRNYNEYSTVTIKFKSGSYVVFEVYNTRDQEYVREKYDAVFRKMSINDVMDYFNAQ